MKKINKYTEYEMFAHYEAWNSSGKTKKDYCFEHGISISTFKYWTVRYNKQDTKKSSRPEFIPVKLKIDTVPVKNFSSGQLHFLFPSGVQLVCPETIDHKVLQNLINP